MGPLRLLIICEIMERTDETVWKFSKTMKTNTKFKKVIRMRIQFMLSSLIAKTTQHDT